MPLSARSKSQRQAGKPVTASVGVGKTPEVRGPAPQPMAEGLALPHERDESINTTATAPDAVIAQAKRDLDAGLVDTDMRVTPGLDAKRRAKLVPGPGGKPPASGR